MKKSRIAHDTAKAMSSLSGLATNVLPQRSTRSLSRFMYNSPDNSGKLPKSEQPTESEEANAPENSRKRKLSSATAPLNAAVKIETSTETEFIQPKKPKKRQPAKRVVGQNGDIKVEPPTGWEPLYSAMKEMRKNIVAPVDTMGCERLAHVKDTPRAQRFQTLVSLMLSSQTKDTVTAAAIRGMQSTLPGGLTLESILNLEPTRLNEFIGKVGFHNIKTKNIKKTAEILRDQFDSDIPDTIEGLISLPGVGPKMAYLCMAAAWGRVEGIGVDVHVHRITNLWRWHKTNTPEETRLALQDWLPKDNWHEINWLLVGLGQTICLPVGRKCTQCDLGLQGLCPAAVGVKKIVKKAKVEIKVEE
jgi:endonuclease-3